MRRKPFATLDMNAQALGAQALDTAEAEAALALGPAADGDADSIMNERIAGVLKILFPADQLCSGVVEQKSYLRKKTGEKIYKYKCSLKHELRCAYSIEISVSSAGELSVAESGTHDHSGTSQIKRGLEYMYVTALYFSPVSPTLYWPMPPMYCSPMPPVPPYLL